jgi:hypothetical protein
VDADGVVIPTFESIATTLGRRGVTATVGMKNIEDAVLATTRKYSNPEG